MKRYEKTLLTTGILAALSILWFIISDHIPLLTRTSEKDLPSITIEDQNTVYCRMSQDDFRFPLPPGSIPSNPQLTSRGFDTVDGSILASFPDNNAITAIQYNQWLHDHNHTQKGANIHATQEPNSPTILIHFTYFGDK